MTDLMGTLRRHFTSNTNNNYNKTNNNNIKNNSQSRRMNERDCPSKDGEDYLRSFGNELHNSFIVTHEHTSNIFKQNLFEYGLRKDFKFGAKPTKNYFLQNMATMPKRTRSAKKTSLMHEEVTNSDKRGTTTTADAIKQVGNADVQHSQIDHVVLNGCEATFTYMNQNVFANSENVLATDINIINYNNNNAIINNNHGISEHLININNGNHIDNNNSNNDVINSNNIIASNKQIITDNPMYNNNNNTTNNKINNTNGIGNNTSDSTNNDTTKNNTANEDNIRHIIVDSMAIDNNTSSTAQYLPALNSNNIFSTTKKNLFRTKTTLPPSNKQHQQQHHQLLHRQQQQQLQEQQQQQFVNISNNHISNNDKNYIKISNVNNNHNSPKYRNNNPPYNNNTTRPNNSNNINNNITNNINNNISSNFNSNVIGNYRLLRTLGKGTYAKVKLAEHWPTGIEVAVKIIDKQRTRPSDLEKIYREIKIHKFLKHPNIVQIYEVIETANHIFIVLELAKRGEIFDYIVSKKRLTETDARDKFRQLLSAVAYLHTNKIVHRDLKVENLLLDADNNIKLCDFGFCNYYDTSSFLDTFCGSPPYAAPELFKGEKYIGPEVDVWSLGVILFTLLTGSLPFDGKTLPELKQKVLQGTFKSPDYVSVRSELFLRKFLKRNPNDRLHLEQALQDDWVSMGYNCAPTYRPTSATLDVNQTVLERMIGMGFPGTEIIESIENKKFNSFHGTYNILCNKVCNSETAFVRSNQRSSTRSNIDFVATSMPLNNPPACWENKTEQKCVNPSRMKNTKPTIQQKSSFSIQRPLVYMTRDVNNNHDHNYAISNYKFQERERKENIKKFPDKPDEINYGKHPKDCSKQNIFPENLIDPNKLVAEDAKLLRNNMKIKEMMKPSSNVERSRSAKGDVVWGGSRVTSQGDPSRFTTLLRKPSSNEKTTKIYRSSSIKERTTSESKLQRTPSIKGADSSYFPSLISHNPNIGMGQPKETTRGHLFKTTSRGSVVSANISRSSPTASSMFRDLPLKKKNYKFV